VDRFTVIVIDRDTFRIEKDGEVVGEVGKVADGQSRAGYWKAIIPHSGGWKAIAEVKSRGGCIFKVIQEYSGI